MFNYKDSVREARQLSDMIIAGAKAPSSASVIKGTDNSKGLMRRQNITENIGTEEAYDVASTDISGLFDYTSAFSKKEEEDIPKQEDAVNREMNTSNALSKSGGRSKSLKGGGISFGGYEGLMGLIDQTEGGGKYDTLFGFSQKEGRAFAGVDVSNMTLGQLKAFSKPSGAYGQYVKGELAKSDGEEARVATPMGRYQFVGKTMREVADAMGLPDDTVFSPEVQDRMFAFKAKQRLSNADSIEGKRKQMRAEWDGFKHVSDAQLDQAIRDFEAGTSVVPVPRPTS